MPASSPPPSPSAGSPTVAVVGSLNLDLVLRVQHAPEAGQTVQADGLQQVNGGKGANQAVACARMGAPVRMIGCVGADAPGERLADGLRAEGIDVRWLRRDAQASTGTAVVVVEASGQNRIVVHPGANATLAFENDSACEQALDGCAAVVMQLETPLATARQVAETAQRRGLRVVLNPSPSLPLDESWWPLVSLLIVNESEAGAYTGTAVADAAAAARAARTLRERGCAEVLVTLGEHGVVVSDARGERLHPAVPVAQVVDTTGAGDTFLGAVVAELMAGRDLDTAARTGLRAASLCVQTAGAQPSIPHRDSALACAEPPPAVPLPAGAAPATWSQA
ncbi:ribokinase [Rubrivivax gelatinosus]|uniref:Ribokinase n=1 Tax=Rubrivivax gelatinosus (strain NBRC 100245 / IL144) TaxID=983917 RepID=I0HQ22_RUBGI|nr:ribokinase [Rubrivivax gelatinosus]BAL95109.1 ribokinase RbsK [Rubrivivax gelatinosus IL144]